MQENGKELVEKELEEELEIEEKEAFSDEAAQEENQSEEAAEELEELEETDSKEAKKKAKAAKKQEKDKMKEKVEELEDKVKRQMAEFDNFRKRTEKEKTAMFEIGAKSVIEKILPVVDNFERGLQSIPEDEKETAFAEGMSMVYKQLMDGLKELGVEPIEAIGTEFNPELHNAVMQVESEEYESGIVAQELLKGYMYRDSVVRHSMVAVAQ